MLVLDKVGDFILIDFMFVEVLFARISTFSLEIEGFVGAVAGNVSLDLGKSVL